MGLKFIQYKTLLTVKNHTVIYSNDDLSNNTMSEWVIKFNCLSDSKVHIVHISSVIVAYTLESLSSLT